MLDLEEITSLTEFQRNTKQHIRRLKKSGRPAVLTVNGQAEVVVQSAEGYQKLLEALDVADAVAGIKRGLKDFEEGNVVSLDEFEREVRQNVGKRTKG